MLRFPKAKKQITVVTGCILDGDRCLFTERYEPELPHVHRKWDFPGGKVEFGEKAEQAIQREVQEELGLAVTPVELIPWVRTNIWAYEKHVMHVVVLCYVCELVTSQSRITLQREEVSRARWFRVGDINLQRTLPGIRDFLGWVARTKLDMPIPSIACEFEVVLHQHDDCGRVRSTCTIRGGPAAGDSQLSLFGSSLETVGPSPWECYRLTSKTVLAGGRIKSLVEDYLTEGTLRRRAADLVKKKLSHGFRPLISDPSVSDPELLTALGGP